MTTPIDPQSKQEALALEIAQTFKDENNIKIYLYLCTTYPETVIYRAYGEVKQTPWHRIRKSRGALFTYLVKFYGKKTNSNPDIIH